MAGDSLFDDLPEQHAPISVLQAGVNPIWTQHKAQLIARYLRYFVFITKHGAYIDGFAGRKNENPESWAAELVLNSEPKRMRQFLLCELAAEKIPDLERLKADQPRTPKRSISIFQGDFNEAIDQILAAGTIKDKTATFCLLDQYTTQCHWATLVKLARHKSPGEKKIELFYFFATGWLNRTLAAFTRDLISPELWWGRPDWRDVGKKGAEQVVVEIATRFRDELGYRFVRAWPIYQKQKGQGRVMFHMIHASDHPEARKLMFRAYKTVLEPPEPEEQLALALGNIPP